MLNKAVLAFHRLILLVVLGSSTILLSFGVIGLPVVYLCLVLVCLNWTPETL